MKKNVIYLFVLVFTLTSCSKSSDEEPITVDNTSVVMNSLDTHQITSNQSSPIYESENEYVAVVSSTGLIKGRHIGSTYIDINGTRKVAVTVEAKYSLFEPLHDASLTKNQVISKRGNPYSEKDTILVYKNPNSEIIGEMYMFNPTTDKLKTSAIVYATSYFLTFNYALAERYEPLTYDESNYYYYYVDAINASDVKLMVVTNLYNYKYCITMYVPKGDNSTSTRSEQNASSYYLEILNAYRSALSQVY
jgi:hypothetical protein